MSNRIATLRNLAGQTAPADTTDTAESFAATLRQLVHIISQTSANPLPTGTRVDWPLPQALSAAARLDEGQQGRHGDGAFRGHGRVLGPMYADRSGSGSKGPGTSEDATPRRYNFRSRRAQGRTDSGSSIRAWHASNIELDEDGLSGSEWEDNGEDGDDDDDDRETAVVIHDQTEPNGTRKIEVQLRRSTGSVTLVIPQEEQDATSAAPPTPAITFQLSPEFQFLEERRPSASQPAIAPIPEAALVSSSSDVDGDENEDESEAGLSSDNALTFLDVPLDEDGHEDSEYKEYDPEPRVVYGAYTEQVSPASGIDCERTHTFRGYHQPPVGRRLEQVLAYLSSQDQTTDRHWYTRIASIETYLDFLQGITRHDAANADTNGYEKRLADMLARVETDEAFALAEAEGRPAIASAIARNAAECAERPPPILGSNTQILLNEARRRLRAHRVFLRYHDSQSQSQAQAPTSSAALPRAHILESVGAVPSYDAAFALGGTQLLQTLLTTSGQSFAARLVIQADAEKRVLAEERRQSEYGMEAAEAESDDDDVDNQENYLCDLPVYDPNAPLASLETHPYTVQMARYRQLRRHWMEEARIVAEQTHGDTAGWATLPPLEGAYSLGYSDVQPARPDGRRLQLLPRPPLPPPMERDRQLLGLLHDLGRLLLRQLNVAPRPLLTDVLRYVEQGLRGLPLPEGGLRLRDEFDWQPEERLQHRQKRRRGAAQRTIRPINETEARWLQFLLSESTSEQLVAPLPQGPHLEEDPSIDPADESDAGAVRNKADEEGSRTLYHAFSNRFQALLNDPSANGLFPTIDTCVPVTALVDAMNRGVGGLPSASPSAAAQTPRQTHFSVYDAVHFLARLRRIGRCRFTHMPLDDVHGVVQRPLLTLHPEHRIHQSGLTRALEDASYDEDDAIGAPRRGIEVDASWHDTMAQGRAQRPVSDEVRTFFCALAFRFGRTLRTLEKEQRPRWSAYLQGVDAERSSIDMRASLQTWERTYRQLLQQNGVLEEARAANVPTSLADVVRLADPETFGDGSLTEDEARDIVRHQLLAEAASGETAPIPSSGGQAQTIWDWGQPEIVGEAPRHFFHMDRWPLHLQTRATAHGVEQEARLAFDPEALWDPASEDPAAPDAMWLRAPNRSYGFQWKRAVEPEYLVGESALQRQVFVRDLTRRVAAAIGMDLEEQKTDERRGLFGWLGSKLLRRSGGGNGRGGGGRNEDAEMVDVIDFEVNKLPTVEDIPRSIDWRSFVEGRGADARVERESGEGRERERQDGRRDGDNRGGRDKEAEDWTDEDDAALLAEIAAAQRGTFV